MKFKKSLISISLLLVFFIVISSVSAVNDDFTNFSTNTSNVTFTNVGDESNLLSDNGLNTNSGDGVDNLASNNSNIIYISPNGT
ncbi:hypothetical protein ACA135_03720 [Methanobrevibacter acididurans]